MKKTVLLALIASLAFSCGKKEKEEEEDPKVEFKNQVAQGKIEGNEWSFKSGTASLYEGRISLDLYEESTLAEICSTDRALDVVFWTMDNTLSEVELCAFDCANSQTVTLLKKENYMNIIVGTGKVQLTKVDTANNIVEGKIVAEFDEDNFVNGNFSAVFCN